MLLSFFKKIFFCHAVVNKPMQTISIIIFTDQGACLIPKIFPCQYLLERG
jgi:hypothetical protein